MTRGSAVSTDPGAYDDVRGPHRTRAILMVLAIVSGIALSGRANAAGFEPSEERPARIGYEALGGVVGGGAGALVGLLSFGALASASSGHSREGGFGLVVVAVGAAMVGGFFGESAGVYWGGRWSGGNGSYWATLGGEAVGVLAGIGLLVLTLPDRGHSEAEMALWIAGLGVLPLAGAVSGYELTTSRTESSAATSVSLAQRPPRHWRLLQWSLVF